MAHAVTAKQLAGMLEEVYRVGRSSGQPTYATIYPEELAEVVLSALTDAEHGVEEDNLADDVIALLSKEEYQA